jgi:hypothetical protein
MIFRFDAPKTGAITYSPMDSACTTYIFPKYPLSFYFEEIHAD